jgi:hypothetical protein
MVVVTCLGADSERLYFPIGRNAIERYRHIILRYAKVVSDPHAGHVKKRSGNSIGTTCREKDHVTTGQSAINVEKAEEHQPSHAKKKKKKQQQKHAVYATTNQRNPRHYALIRTMSPPSSETGHHHGRKTEGKQSNVD